MCFHFEKWSSKLGVEAAKGSCIVYTTEAEYVAAIEVCKELIWLKDFKKQLDKEQVTLSLHSDSQSAINLVSNLVYHDRAKHIDVQYHSSAFF